jgi:hypothetical protein
VNKRIRQLAEQVVGPSRLHGGDFALMGNKQVEKFAELIIKECADIATMNQFQWDSTGSYVLKHFEEKL